MRNGVIVRAASSSTLSWRTTMNSHDERTLGSGSFAPHDQVRYLTLLAAVSDLQTTLDVLDRRTEELLGLTSRLVEDVLEGE
jgi:hypothetical protein